MVEKIEMKYSSVEFETLVFLWKIFSRFPKYEKISFPAITKYSNWSDKIMGALLIGINSGLIEKTILGTGHEYYKLTEYGRETFRSLSGILKLTNPEEF